MLSQNQMVRASLEALYRDMAVFFVESVMEDENGVLKSVEEQSEPFPCRLSYEVDRSLRWTVSQKWLKTFAYFSPQRLRFQRGRRWTYPILEGP